MNMRDVHDNGAMHAFQLKCPMATVVSVYTLGQLFQLSRCIHEHPVLITKLIYGNGLPLIFDKITIDEVLAKCFADFYKLSSIPRATLPPLFKYLQKLCVIDSSGVPKNVSFSAMENLEELSYTGAVITFSVNLENLLELIVICMNFVSFDGLSESERIQVLNLAGTPMDMLIANVGSSARNITLPCFGNVHVAKNQLAILFPNMVNLVYPVNPVSWHGLENASKLKRVERITLFAYIDWCYTEFNPDEPRPLAELDFLSFAAGLSEVAFYLERMILPPCQARKVKDLEILSLTGPTSLSGFNVETVTFKQVLPNGYVSGTQPPVSKVVLCGEPTDPFVDCVEKSIRHASQLDTLYVCLRGKRTPEYFRIKERLQTLLKRKRKLRVVLIADP
jgi:hypothetical protein